jgi:tetratricopeptide (TPR) repeat protein
MAPEQRAALRALTEGPAAAAAVGAAADVYALGLVLYEALGGPVPPPGGRPPRLDRLNAAVSPGLADVLAKCLEDDPRRRYGTAADLAGDLRRHVHDLPLFGVPNRRPELWRKWRRRAPHQFRAYFLGAVAAAAVAATAVLGAFSFQERERAGAAQAAAARDQAAAKQARAAEQQARAAADHEKAVRALQRLTAYLRFYSADPQLRRPTPDLDADCREVWKGRQAALDAPAAEQAAVRADLLDLVLLWTDLRLARAAPDDAGVVREEAGRVLDEAAALLGPSPALNRARQRLAGTPGKDEPAAATAGDHYALGLTLYQAGDLPDADVEFREALRLDPRALWPQFYHGVCAYHRTDPEAAVAAFTACVVLARSREEMARHLYNRAKALKAAGRSRQAMEDYDLALESDPGLALAALNRALLLHDAGRDAEALRDLQRALDGGADPATVLYNRARVEWDQKNGAAALADLRQALRHDPQNADALRLYEQIRDRR